MKLGKMMYYDKGQVPFEDGDDRMRYGRTLVTYFFETLTSERLYTAK